MSRDAPRQFSNAVLYSQSKLSVNFIYCSAAMCVMFMFSMIDSYYCFCPYLTEKNLPILKTFSSAYHIQNHWRSATMANGIKKMITFPLIPYSYDCCMTLLNGGTNLLRHYYFIYKNILSIPVAARSKAQVFGRSPAQIVGSNPTGGMDVCLL